LPAKVDPLHHDSCRTARRRLRPIGADRDAPDRSIWAARRGRLLGARGRSKRGKIKAGRRLALQYEVLFSTGNPTQRNSETPCQQYAHPQPPSDAIASHNLSGGAKVRVFRFSHNFLPGRDPEPIADLWRNLQRFVITTFPPSQQHPSKRAVVIVIHPVSGRRRTLREDLNPRPPGSSAGAFLLVSRGQNVGNGPPHLLHLRPIRVTLGTPRRP
jgi:hypothetical protein